jgi:hypothetical protein
MDVANLRKRDQPTVRPAARLDGAAVDPIGGVGVSADLEVFAQLLVADGAPLGEQGLDLLENQRVAFDRGRVVRLLEPDAAPDVLRLERGREPTEALPQLADLHAEPVVHGSAGWASATRVRDFVRLRH